MENTQEKPPELTISDLQNIKAVFETCVRRGAFGAEELSSVGVVYDRLSAFLNAVSAQRQQQEAKPEQQ